MIRFYGVVLDKQLCLFSTELHESHIREPRGQQSPAAHQSHGGPGGRGPVNQSESLGASRHKSVP